MSISESEYKKQKRDISKKNDELDKLGKRIEPYWDKKSRALKKDAPEENKNDYERFLELFNELSIKN